MLGRRIVTPYTKVTVVSLLAFALLGAGVLANARPASADPSINIWSIPSISHKFDGMNQVIGVKALLETGDFVDVIRVIVDPGTGEELVYEFEANGDEVSTDDGFIDVFCKATFFSNGYAIGPSKVDCKLVLDKDSFDVGTHPTRLELELDSGTFTDNSQFRLLSSPTSLADIENKSFTAPSTSKRGSIKSTFTQEKNDGNRNAEGHWIRIYLSSDTTLSQEDKEVGRYFVSFLGEGKTRTFNIKATIPGNYPTGPENYISFVDANNQIGEQDEFNNQRTKATNITS
jgi:hypothetical protein